MGGEVAQLRGQIQRMQHKQEQSVSKGDFKSGASRIDCLPPPFWQAATAEVDGCCAQGSTG